MFLVSDVAIVIYEILGIVGILIPDVIFSRRCRKLRQQCEERSEREQYTDLQEILKNTRR